MEIMEYKPIQNFCTTTHCDVIKIEYYLSNIKFFAFALTTSTLSAIIIWSRMEAIDFFHLFDF